MTSLTMDAALEVDASQAFPLVFPILFAPAAGVTRSALATMTMAVTVSRPATLGHTNLATTSLAATLTPSAAMTLHARAAASLAVTVAPGGVGDGGTSQEKAHTSLPLTVTPTAHLLSHDVASTMTTAVLTFTAAAAHGRPMAGSLSLTATRSATLSRKVFAAASLPVTVTRTANLGKKLTADAPLAVTTGLRCSTGNIIYLDAALAISVSIPFPYVFPFVFEASSDDLSQGCILDANSTTVTVDPTASLIKGVSGDSSLAIDVGLTGMVFGGGDHQSDALLEISVATDPVTLALEGLIDADQEIDEVSDQPGLVWDALFEADNVIVALSSPILTMSARIASMLDVYLSTFATAPTSSSIDTALGLTITTGSSLSLGVQANANLQVALALAVRVGQDLSMNATLVIYTAAHAAAPEASPFYPFYLR